MRGFGVSCNENGVFAGAVLLLERVCDPGIGEINRWRPRPLSALNHDLSVCYGLPVEFDRKMDGVSAVVRALGRSDIVCAQLATLHLEIPDPPTLTKSTQTSSNILDLARQLRSSGMLKADWDPAKHPRWPAGSPGSIGGEFAPADGMEDPASEVSSAPVVPAQITIPVPFEFEGGIPFPSEIIPPPVIPNINPRDLPKNPYPDRPECEQEWAEATSFCLKLKASNLLGRGDYRGMGSTLSECITGQVSEDCGGNSTGT